MSRRAAPVIALAAACAAATVSMAFGTYAVGGADSYGYVSQAELLARGRLTEPPPRDPGFTWPDAPATLTPLGFTGGPGGALAPLYPPGLPLLMAPLALVDRRAVFLLLPLCAAAAVWLCWRLGHELGEPVAGGIAAGLLAVSPTFLYQAVQPMSDVPATACWLGALVMARGDSRWRTAAAGAIASIAILIRPNLAPLLLLLAVVAATRRGRFETGRAGLCSAAALPGLVLLGVIQQVRYGSPLASGYGPFDELFSLSFAAPNLARYPRWLVETHTPFIALWLFAPLWIRHENVAAARWLGWCLWLFCAGVLAAYLPYVYFRPEEWFYTRFLLPAIPLMLLLGAIAVVGPLRRVWPRGGEPAAAILAVGVGVVCAMAAGSAGVFSLHEAERKFPDVGRFVRDHLPAHAFVLAAQHSGSVRYYAGRRTLRWDVLRPDALDHALSDLRAAGYAAYLVLDPEEEEAFRQRFEAESAEALDRLAPIVSIRRTRIYAFSHRVGGTPPDRPGPASGSGSSGHR